MTPDPPKYPFARTENTYDLPEETKRLRDNGPVSRVQLFDGAPAWIVGRHKEVCEMLGSEKLSNVRPSRLNMDVYAKLETFRSVTTVKATQSYIQQAKAQTQRRLLFNWIIQSTRSRGLSDSYPAREHY